MSSVFKIIKEIREISEVFASGQMNLFLRSSQVTKVFLSFFAKAAALFLISHIILDNLSLITVLSWGKKG